MSRIAKLVLVSGFLGSGKTSLILAGARQLLASGKKVALIMNDQDSELVDTEYARAERFNTAEVAGGCFCCKFSDLLDRANELRNEDPDVIFAEPVGSCIDLSATILQPFHAFHRDSFSIAPLTVLMDPRLGEAVFTGQAASQVTYLFEQQIREADIVCITKADLYPEVPALPFPWDFQTSARSGLGVASWLEEVLHGQRVAGARLLDVDYQQYASAEAALAWLNAHIAIHLRRPLSPAELIGPLLEKLDAALSAQDITIAHLKLFDRTRSAHLMASIRANGARPDPQGSLIAEAETEHGLAINLRAIGEANGLRKIVTSVLSKLDGTITVGRLRAFHPAPPKPEYRFKTLA